MKSKAILFALAVIGASHLTMIPTPAAEENKQCGLPSLDVA